MTPAKKRKEVTEEEAVNAIAAQFGITDADVEEAKRHTFNVRNAVIQVPGELRLGQAIVNALGHLHKGNPTINEDPSTALFYVTDQELQKAINEFHKPYGFGSK